MAVDILVNREKKKGGLEIHGTMEWCMYVAVDGKELGPLGGLGALLLCSWNHTSGYSVQNETKSTSEKQQ